MPNELKRRENLALLVRESFRNIGESPESHIYDYCPSNIYSGNNELLHKIKSIYESLGNNEKRILLSECLEKGRYYQFWYIPYMSERQYKKEVASFFKRLWERIYE